MLKRKSGIIAIAGAAGLVMTLGAGSGQAYAGNILSQIPSNARLCVVDNNLATFDHKIQALAGKMNLPLPNDPLTLMEQSMGIGSGLDEHGTIGLVVMQPTPGHPHPTVALFPIAHIQAAFAAESISKPDAHGICTTQAPNGTTGYVAQRGVYAVMAQHESALKEYLQSTHWGMPNLIPADAQRLTTADLACYVNVAAVRKQALAMLAKGMRMIRARAQRRTGGTKAKAMLPVVLSLEALAARQVVEQTHSLIFTANIHPDGIALQLGAAFVPGSSLAKLLAKQPPLAGKPLMGLPGGRYMAAGAVAVNPGVLGLWISELMNQVAKDPKVGSMPEFATFRKKMQPSLTMLSAVGNSRTALDWLPPIGPQGAIIHGIEVQHVAHAFNLMRKGVAQIRNMYGFKALQENPNIKLTLQVHPHAFVIAGVTFTRVHVDVALRNNPAVPRAAMAQSVMAALYGAHGTNIDVGAVDAQHLVSGVNVSRRELAQAVAAIKARRDSLDLQHGIAAQAPHLLAHPQMVGYLPLDSWLRLAMDRMSAAAGGGAAPQAGPAPAAPVTISATLHGSQIAGEMFIPTEQLTALVSDGRAMAMMVMMSMMQGGGPPPPPPGQ